jgi:toxin ParE1/3/4
MARYRLSETADAKISAIYEYSLLQFGENQADRYFLGMHKTFEILAGEPYLGSRSTNLDSDIRQFVYKSHIIFYKPISDGIFIVDIFAARQLPPSILQE